MSDLDNKNCYLCGSNKVILLKEGTRDNPDINLLRCETCGLQQLDSFDHISKEHYVESNMGYPSKCVLDDDRRVERLKSIFLQKNVLEFGSGLGGFCQKIKKYVNNITAIDLDHQAAETYKKNNIDFLRDTTGLKEGFYDYIVMFHVLEHLKDPVSELNNLKKFLKSGGSFYIEVPNAKDALLEIYRSEEFLNFNTYADHLFTFTSENLKTIAKKCGLRVDSIEQVQRYPLSNHMLWIQEGRGLGHVKYDFLNDELLNQVYSSTLAKSEACDTLFAKFTLG